MESSGCVEEQQASGHRDGEADGEPMRAAVHQAADQAEACQGDPDKSEPRERQIVMYVVH